jgi:hypothetical protein
MACCDGAPSRRGPFAGSYCCEPPLRLSTLWAPSTWGGCMGRMGVRRVVLADSRPLLIVSVNAPVAGLLEASSRATGSVFVGGVFNAKSNLLTAPPPSFQPFEAEGSRALERLLRPPVDAAAARSSPPLRLLPDWPRPRVARTPGAVVIRRSPPKASHAAQPQGPLRCATSTSSAPRPALGATRCGSALPRLPFSSAPPLSVDG